MVMVAAGSLLFCICSSDIFLAKKKKRKKEKERKRKKKKKQKIIKNIFLKNMTETVVSANA